MAEKTCSKCGASAPVDAARCTECDAEFAAADFDRTVAAPKPAAPAPGDDLDATIAGGAAAMPMDPLIGKELGGCVIETLLGAGAMGAVYRATQTGLDRTVAVKTIRRELSGDATLLGRFQQEAKTIGRFNTPHVVQVYDVGREDGVNYLVMEYVDGGNLRTYAHKQPEEKITNEDATRFLREACEGLKEAQSLGVIHRDIKPDNLMLSDKGTLKIADFGIAKVMSQDMHLTMTSELTGTPLYMSPEQCRGDELDFRTDMYSLGATFYYLLSGKPPAQGSSVFELIQTKTKLENLSLDKVLPVPGSAGPLARVIEKMTQLEPEDRYGSYDELLEDLERVTSGQVIPPVKARERAPVAPRRVEAEPEKKGSGALVATVVLLLLVGGGGAAWGMGLFDPEDPGTQGTTENGESGTQGDGVFTPRKPIDDVPPKDPPEDPPEDDEQQPTDPDKPEQDPNAAGTDEVEDPPADPPQPDPGEVLAAEIAGFAARIETLSNDFVREGPEAVATEASQLVVELTRKPAAFADTLAAARSLDRDVQLAIGIRRDVQGLQPPVVQLEDLDPVENFVTTQSQKSHVHEAATQAFKDWMNSEIVEAVTRERAALATSATERLSELWSQCQRLERESNWDGLADAMRKLAESRTRLAGIFPDVDFDAAAPRDDVARFEEALAQYERVVEFRGEIRTAIDAVDAQTLAGWVAGDGERVSEMLETLQGRATGPLATPDVEAELGALASKVRFWDEYTNALGTALTNLSNADVDATSRTLGALAEQHRVDDLPGYQSVSAARNAVAEAYDALLTRLELDSARAAFDRGRNELVGLAKLLPAAAEVRRVLETNARACAALRDAVADMAPVAAAEVALSTDEVEPVEAYFIDRCEVSRAQYKVFVTSVRDLGDAAAKKRLSYAIAQLDAGEFDKRASHPVERVTFQEAQAYLSAQGKAMPTLPEWWLAALGPADGPSKYPWGDAQPKPQEFNMTGGPQEVDEDGFARRFGTGTQAVHHLAGNVAEWLESGADRKILIGGHYRLNGVLRREQAAGRAISARPNERRAGVGFRGVIRPAEFLRQNGCILPRK